MQTLFCTNCGHKLMYSEAKPKFCGFCGTPIGGVSPRQTSEAKAPKTLREQMEAREKGGGENDEGDSTDIDYVPQIEGLEYEISAGDIGNSVHKFEDVFNVSAKEEEKPATQKKRRGRPKKKR